MSGAALQPADPQKPAKVRPFRRAVLRGLGVVMPPLLTLVLFIWAWATIDSYVLKPIETGIGQTIVFFSVRANVKSSIPIDANVEDVMVVDRSNERIPPDKVLLAAGRVEGIERTARAYAWRVVSFRFEGTQFVPTSDHKWVPDDVFDEVKGSPGKLSLSNATANEIYERYVQLRYFPRWRTIPIFLVVFVSVLYLLGRFLAAGVGRIFVTGVEALINRLPVVRNVYSSVKQVTDFVFSERDIEFNRVVAIQYPRTGIWSIGFVTGESMLDISSAANEPVLSVLMPTSPMPATGFTVTVRKSETVDLDITIDQAIQFIVSCGVVVPAHQQASEMGGKISHAIARRLQAEMMESESAEPAGAPERRSLSEPSDNGDGIQDAATEPTTPPSALRPPAELPRTEKPPTLRMPDEN